MADSAPAKLPVIGITRGDPAGIGPEIIEAALNSGRLPSFAEYRIIGKECRVEPGRPSLESGRAALASLEESCELLKSGKIDAVVTAPVSKQALHQAGFDFPGQTEFFAQRLNASSHAMCLTGPRLTVGLTTIHIPLSDVPAKLSKAEIHRVGALLAEFCQHRGISHPKVAVCGLNPHAGEEGAFGSEEIEIIAPAIEVLNATFADKAKFSGPHVPDAIFRDAAMGKYDAVLAMYHDQGLIPLKLLDFDTAVNTTLGLPYPRTSPDHGTAYDIAGKGLANPSSMIAAITLAVELATGTLRPSNI